MMQPSPAQPDNGSPEDGPSFAEIFEHDEKTEAYKEITEQLKKENGSPEDLCECGHKRSEHRLSRGYCIGDFGLDHRCGCSLFRPLSKSEPEGGEPRCLSAAANQSSEDTQNSARSIMTASASPAAQESNPPDAAKEILEIIASQSWLKDSVVLKCFIDLVTEKRLSALTRELEEAKAEVAAQYQKTEYAKEVRRNMAKMYEDAIRKRDQEHEQTKAELAERTRSYETCLNDIEVTGQEYAQLQSALSATRKELEELRARYIGNRTDCGHLKCLTSGVGTVGECCNACETNKAKVERDTLRARLAEIYTEVDGYIDGAPDAKPWLPQRPQDAKEWREITAKESLGKSYLGKLADYPNDLNACHAFEEGLTDEEWDEYRSALVEELRAPKRLQE